MQRDRSASRASVLLVEDEDLLRWSIQRFLERRGFLVATAKTGDEALARIAEGASDLLITDLSIGDPDGLALAAAARRLHPATQVVIITGQGSKETVLRALRQGVADYVEKPFDLELILLAAERALERAAVQRELVRLARTDDLTGLWNQRHFYAELEAEMARARRQERPLALLLVDVDEFKRFNDRHGHLAGDAALARLAGCLRRACRRDTDHACRFGGDEFVLLLPEADLAAAESVGGRVRELVREEGVDLTVSVGIAELRDGMDLKALIREADEAMYRGKRERRALPAAG